MHLNSPISHRFPTTTTTTLSLQTIPPHYELHAIPSNNKARRPVSRIFTRTVLTVKLTSLQRIPGCIPRLRPKHPPLFLPLLASRTPADLADVKYRVYLFPSSPSFCLRPANSSSNSTGRIVTNRASSSGKLVETAKNKRISNWFTQLIREVCAVVDGNRRDFRLRRERERVWELFHLSQPIIVRIP